MSVDTNHPLSNTFEEQLIGYIRSYGLTALLRLIAKLVDDYRL